MIFTGKVDDLTVIDPQNRVWAKTQNGKFQFEAERKFYSSLGSREVVIWKVVKHSFIETLYVSPFVWKMELSHVPCVFFFARYSSGLRRGCWGLSVLHFVYRWPESRLFLKQRHLQLNVSQTKG